MLLRAIRNPKPLFSRFSWRPSSFSTMASSSRFSKAVVTAMRKLYPEELADKTWDNTGLLLEAPYNSTHNQRNSVLLAIDLTRSVTDEAINLKASIVIAYHPIIFKGLKSLTLDNPQQCSLLRLAAAGISVYCPHTALDTATGGINDWLADVITTSYEPLPRPVPQSSLGKSKFIITHLSSTHESLKNQTQHSTTISHDRLPIIPINSSSPAISAAHLTAGQGRIIRLHEPVCLTILLANLQAGIGNQHGLPVAVPQTSSCHPDGNGITTAGPTNLADIRICSIGICAGSGAGLFHNLQNHVDLLLTGELSHHDTLAATERGQCVVSVFHSNSERGFLNSVLKPQLKHELEKQWLETEEGNKSITGNAKADETIQVLVSEIDRDPYGIVKQHLVLPI